jgi:hypothetical protein
MYLILRTGKSGIIRNFTCKFIPLRAAFTNFRNFNLLFEIQEFLRNLCLYFAFSAISQAYKLGLLILM